MHDDRYPADRMRLISMVEDVMPESALTSHDDASAEALREHQSALK
jgi:hypothetical protein